ncbi:hypothetical protein CYFUS_008919 [Cystobacter fuscus]|uniref:Uncharacterized protein n=1 Tax=Cystobacter fuscus TaxID=43 RepID=A0A250JHS2_9BACT|nr:hypothetical protein CYFUS_008919 [Cystobacter fuscus]
MTPPLIVRVLGALSAAVLLGGCPTSRYLFIPIAHAPSGSASNCIEVCSRALGVPPSVSCGWSGEEVRCIYSERAPALPSRPLEDSACRASCTKAGMPDVESCEAITAMNGEPLVACAYRVGYL